MRAKAILIIIFTALNLVTGASQAQEPKLPADPVVIGAKALVIAESDSEVRRLLKQRYNAALSEFKDLYALFVKGRAPFSDTCLAIETLAKCGSELPETPVARVSELEMAFDAAMAIERFTVDKHANGQEPRFAVEYVRVCRLGIEIDLVRARDGAKAAREPK